MTRQGNPPIFSNGVFKEHYRCFGMMPPKAM